MMKHIDITPSWGGRPIHCTYRTDTSDYNTLLSCLHDDEYFAKELSAGDVVIDLGAHIGAATLAFLSRGATVYSVEMIPENQEIFRIQMRDNHFSPRLYAAAVTGDDRKSVRAYYWDTSSEMGSVHEFIGTMFPRKITSLGTQKDGRNVRVQTISLAKILTEAGKCDLLKCDIEGAEWDVFRSLPSELLAKIHRIVIELHTRDGRPFSRKDFAKLLGPSFVDKSEEKYPTNCQDSELIHAYFENSTLQ